MSAEIQNAVKHVVQYSGGVGSWAAAKLVAQKHGIADLVLLFADVKDEHPDLYRFLHEGAANIGLPVTIISEGRTPRQVMSDEALIGNSRKDPCSKLLKRRLLDRWCRQNCDPASTVRYIGIDWTESHRLQTFCSRIAPWRAEAPLCDQLVSKSDAKAMLEREGIELPYLYRHGFEHNNCGGACIKAGQGQWAKLLKLDPQRYADWEQWEQEMRTRVGDHSILRDRSKAAKARGATTLTLQDFRKRVQAGGEYDQYEIGGCACGF
jgi:3'-phosphoadenosine 5'-phosphosulfate sulfotransferase (PAPS reductase)/FAD synthetase